MQNFSPSPFHTELFNYLLSSVEKKIREEGLEQEQEFASYRDTLKNISEEHHSFIEILENYHRLFSKKKTIPIEKKMLEAFPPKEFPLNISRGLPRIYRQENPSINHIKEEFSNLLTLKQLGAERFLLPLYEQGEIPKDAKICLLTYMLPDGWGDLIAHQEIAKILKARFPQNQVRSVLYIPKSVSLKECNFDGVIIEYDKECPPFSEKEESIFCSSDLILSIPTFYPHTEELKKKFPASKLLSIGQYGFIESEKFHPRSQNYSMGLHFLEKGVLIREQTEKKDFRTLENQTLLFALFGTVTPQTIDIETYHASHKFYLAYLVSPIGGAIYLHALLQLESNNHKTLDICSPHIGWLIEYIKKRQTEQKPLLEGDFGIREIEIHCDGKIHRNVLAASGKTVRVLCPGALSDRDFRKALLLSEEFIAVRGDQSFSEAISASRLFFYDGALHARYFVKDLLALAENRLRQNTAALSFFRCMGQSFLHNIADEPSDWVEETYFQEKEPWEQIAKTLGLALQSPKTLIGCRQLSEIIRNEYSFNKTVCQIVLREFFHRQFPEKGQREKNELLAFAEGKQTLKETLSNLRRDGDGRTCSPLS